METTKEYCRSFINTVIETRTVGHVTPLFVRRHRIEWANQHLAKCEKDFQRYRITDQDEMSALIIGYKQILCPKAWQIINL